MSAAIELEAVSTDPLAAALLEIASLHEQLAASEAACTSYYRMYQSALHRAEAAEARLGAEARAAKTGGYELEVHCDTRDCVTPPLRIRSAPPEDAVPQWIRGCGWLVDADRHLCPKCGGGR